GGRAGKGAASVKRARTPGSSIRRDVGSSCMRVISHADPVLSTRRPPRSRRILTAGSSTGRTAMGKLDGKVALISGGARGQGAAEAETIAREGAKVVFGGVRDGEGQEAEVAVSGAGYHATDRHLNG